MALKLPHLRAALAPLFRGRALSTSGAEKAVKESELWVAKSEVTRFMVDTMVKVGTPLDSAELLADNLVMADERGHFSHGLNRLSIYVEDITTGNCDPRAVPEVRKETDATAWVDGKNGLGVVIGKYWYRKKLLFLKPDVLLLYKHYYSVWTLQLKRPRASPASGGCLPSPATTLVCASGTRSGRWRPA